MLEEKQIFAIQSDTNEFKIKNITNNSNFGITDIVYFKNKYFVGDYENCIIYSSDNGIDWTEQYVESNCYGISYGTKNNNILYYRIVNIEDGIYFNLVYTLDGINFIKKEMHNLTIKDSSGNEVLSDVTFDDNTYYFYEITDYIDNYFYFNYYDNSNFYVLKTQDMVNYEIINQYTIKE